MKRDFLALRDFSAEEIQSFLTRAVAMKSDSSEKSRCPLIGKSIGLLFEKSSTRTRVSFEVGAYQLGAQAVSLNAADLQMGRGETVRDTARNVSRYLDAIVIRTSDHERLREFAPNATIPVVNGLSDLHHPCQVLADLMTIQENKGKLRGLRIAYIGDGNNVANSLVEAASRMEMDIIIACPEGRTRGALLPDHGANARRRCSPSGRRPRRGRPRGPSGSASRTGRGRR